MFLIPRPQMRPPPAPVVGGAGSGPFAAAAPAPVVASGCAAAGYQRRLWERREGKEVVGGEGMRASDICGVGGPAATPAPARRSR